MFINKSKKEKGKDTLTDYLGAGSVITGTASSVALGALLMDLQNVNAAATAAAAIALFVSGLGYLHYDKILQQRISEKNQLKETAL